ncbi:hypothetical protein [Microbispora siamensis]|uniref:Uncharacterized protein n=1 Tax=Microbispora siamensis TaxID=564413 RepID=A0ABQ4GUW6_9ACTN|nr:hypothetical protein [Microbispora siamensis]GIH65229.1 hypothetical protein Msi02_60460 [Microbispora siamensis]
MVSTVAESRSLGRAKAGLVAMAVVAAGTAIFDVAARPRGGTEALLSVAYYVFTALRSCRAES